MCAVATGAAVELRGRAARTMNMKLVPLATFHLERSALNDFAPSNCDAAGTRAAVSERGAGAHAGALLRGVAAAGPGDAHHMPEVRSLGHVPLGEVGVELGRAVELRCSGRARGGERAKRRRRPRGVEVTPPRGRAPRTM